MKRKNNLVQSKRTQTPEREPGETSITSLPKKEFKISHNQADGVAEKRQELRDDFWRETTEMKQTMEGLKSRLDEVQETADGIENRNTEKLRQREIKGSIGMKEYVRELCDQCKWNNIRIIGVPEEEREKGIESVFEEIIAENFPKLGEEIIDQTTEVHRTPNRRDPKRPTQTHNN